MAVCVVEGGGDEEQKRGTDDRVCCWVIIGIFFKFDLEALSMTVEERTTTMYQFLIRLAGVIGECSEEPTREYDM